MKILIIGGTGIIGREVVKELSSRHTIITATPSHGDFHVDIADPQSIEKLYQDVGSFDALISTTGKVHFGRLTELTTEQYDLGLQNKLMGQVNCVLIGMKYINDNGSFTLTSGLLNHDPIVFGSAASMVNGALDGFVRGASIEMPRGIRINVVSPTVVTEAMPKYEAFFRGFESVSAQRVALAYSKSVEGAQTGQIYRVGW